MQCYLGQYQGAASNREEKLVRAIDSVIGQGFDDWELIVVADGCERTYEIIASKYAKEKRIDCFLVKKQPMWSGSCRNFGISKATGEYVVYLDADDFFGTTHLSTINRELDSFDWVWFNDMVPVNDSFLERNALITQRYQYGTANICHKRSLGAKWTSSGYGMDDYGLGQHLLSLSKNYEKIATPEYIVCHIPGKIDV